MRRSWHAATLLVLVAYACAGDSGPASLGEQGTVGGSCKVNADCANSEAAREFMNVRCPATQIYCLAGVCHANCATTCQAFRTDLNPCPDGGLCAPLSHESGYCSIEPIRCAAVMDCPVYRPVDASGQSQEWKCEQNVCRYPGISYVTQ